MNETIPKGNMGYDQYTVPDDCSCRTYFCCFPLALANTFPWPFVPILSNFFETKRTQNHPQCLSGLPRALFPTAFLEIAVYTCVFRAVPAFVVEHGRGSCRHPSLCSGSRSSGGDTSFELPFIAWVAFRLNFMAGIILHFIFLACVASTCFIAYVAFSCYGMCRFHVGFSRRVSPSS